MIRLAALALVLTVSAGSAGAAPRQTGDRLPAIGKVTSYASARKALEQAGFTPLRQEADAGRCLSHGDICTGLPEVSACTRVDIAVCRFEWSSASGRFTGIVEARGEDVAGMKVIRAFRLPFNDDPPPLEAAYE
jgi:hypothetical protein